MINNEALDGHERFRKLSALADSGTLSAFEWLELKSHLKGCASCREVQAHHRLLTRVGIPFLAAAHGDPQEHTEWDNSEAREKLLARVRTTKLPSPARRE